MLVLSLGRETRIPRANCLWMIVMRLGASSFRLLFLSCDVLHLFICSMCPVRQQLFLSYMGQSTGTLKHLENISDNIPDKSISVTWFPCRETGKRPAF